MKNAGCENMDLIRPSGTFPCGGRQGMSHENMDLIRPSGTFPCGGRQSMDHENMDLIRPSGTFPCGGRQYPARQAAEAGAILSSETILPDFLHFFKHHCPWAAAADRA